MPDPTEIAGTLLAHGGGEQDRSPRFHPRLDERLADRDERSQTARVVGDAGALEPRAATRHGNIQFRTKYRVQMRGYHDASVAGHISIPSPHVPHVVHAHVLQSHVA